MTRKTDRRSLRTQSAIKKALEELLAEKNISEISITELTERADIHRATFYLHYEDIYDLYQDYKMDIFKMTDLTHTSHFMTPCLIILQIIQPL